jgi:RNA-dependent RNA polymerase
MKIGTLRDHSKKWSTTLGPKWKDKVEEKKKGEKRGRDVMDNKPYLKRPRQLGRFVMDEITELAEQMANQQLAKLVELFNTFKSTMQPDSDLIDPWLKAVKIAKRYAEEEGSNRMQRDLEAIANHVRRIRVKHREQIRGAGPMSPRKENRGALFTELPIEMRQDKIRALSQEFASWPGPEDVLMEESEMRRVRASFAYYHDTVEVGARKGELKWTRFPFDVAMRDLCAIKGMFFLDFLSLLYADQYCSTVDWAVENSDVEFLRSFLSQVN